nr:hypothetical protein [Tanacetum cinerariifolium]
MAYKIEAQELEIINLKARVKLLEDRDGGGVAQSGDDAPIKGRSLDEGEEETEKGSDDTEEMVSVLTSLAAVTVLSSGVAKVPTGSGSISTVGPLAKIKAQELELTNLKARVKLLEDREGGVTVLSSGVAKVPTGSGSISTVGPLATGVPTGSEVVPTASPIFTTVTEPTPCTRKKGKEKMVESDTPKKKKKLQEQIDVQVARELEEEMAKDAQRMNEQIARDAEIARIHAEQELQITIDGLDRNNETFAKQLCKSAQIPNSAKKASHKEAAKRIQDFIPIGSKEESERLKRKGIRFEQDSAKKLKTSEEVPEEKLKEMMELIPVEEVYVEALQVKHLIIDWEHFDRKDLNQLWALVKVTLNIRPAASDKEMELWVEPKRLVHHVISKDQEIFMLVEKDYPPPSGRDWQ